MPVSTYCNWMWADIRTYVCTYTCMHVCMYVHMHTCVHTPIHIHMYGCMYILCTVCTYVHVWMYVLFVHRDMLNVCTDLDNFKAVNILDGAPRLGYPLCWKAQPALSLMVHPLAQWFSLYRRSCKLWKTSPSL